MAIKPGARKEIKGTPNTFPLSEPIAKERTIKNNREVNNVIHVGNIPVISKDLIKKRFNIDSLVNEFFTNNIKIESFKNNLFNNYPFYENILFNKNSETIQTAIYLDKSIVNNIERIEFVNKIFIPSITFIIT